MDDIYKIIIYDNNGYGDNIIGVKMPAGISFDDVSYINKLIKEHNDINSELDKEIDNSDAQSWDSKHSRKINIIRNINDTIQKYKPLPPSFIHSSSIHSPLYNQPTGGGYSFESGRGGGGGWGWGDISPQLSQKNNSQSTH